MTRNRAWIAAFLVVIVFFFLFLALRRINEPIKIFEWEYYAAARSVLETGKPWVTFSNRVLAIEHPPLYVHAVALFLNVFGVHRITARMLGVVFILLLVPIMAALSKRTASESDGGGVNTFVLGALLFLLNPAAIQGSTILGAPDQNIFAFALAAFFALLFLWEGENQSRLKTIVLGLCFGVCLMAKLTTAMVLAPSLFIYYAANKDWEGISRGILICLVGTALFLGAWGAYCRLIIGGEHLFSPIQYMAKEPAAGMALNGSGLDLIKRVGFEGLRITLWFSVFWMGLALFFAFERARNWLHKRRLEPVDLLLLVGTAVGVIYLILRGTSAGFPKYQFPVLPLLCVGIAAAVYPHLLHWRKIDYLAFGGALAVLVLYNISVVGDSLFTLNYTLKEASLAGTLAPALSALGRQATLSVLPAVLFAAPFLAISRRPLSAKIALILLLFTLGSYASMNALQWRAGYYTTLSYGASGDKLLIGRLKKSLAPTDLFVGPYEIRDEIGNLSPGLPTDYWGSPEDFLRFVKDRRPEAIVYSIASNTIDQQRVLESVRVREGLQADYDTERIDSYVLMLRKKDAKGKTTI